MPPRNDLGRGGRVLAACLAGIWIGAGSIAIVIGVRLRPGVLTTLIGLLALGYGWLWARVALTGQRLRWALGPPRGARVGAR
jgi:hypothetical protein